MNPIGIFLAAGCSQRFGCDKLLYPFDEEATPLAIRSLQAVQPACAEWISVLRPEQVKLATLLGQYGVHVFFDASVAQGMGRSLAQAVKQSARAAGWLVALADMPDIQLPSAQAVVQALRQGVSLAAPSYAGLRGHPVGFSACWGPALTQLSGDQGARDLLSQYHQQLTLIPTADPGVLWDIDTPQALAMPRARPAHDLYLMG